MSKKSVLAATLKSSKGLRDTLFKELDRLRNDEITPQKAREVSRVSQQILSSVKLEIEAARFVSMLSGKDPSKVTGKIPEIAL